MLQSCIICYFNLYIYRVVRPTLELELLAFLKEITRRTVINFSKAFLL